MRFLSDELSTNHQSAGDFLDTMNEYTPNRTCPILSTQCHFVSKF